MNKIFFICLFLTCSLNAAAPAGTAQPLTPRSKAQRIATLNAEFTHLLTLAKHQAELPPAERKPGHEARQCVQRVIAIHNELVSLMNHNVPAKKD